MFEISFLAAFVGGVLSLLSPCSALLLPAFFAYAFTSRRQLLGRTLLFLAGLSAVFVPLGMGASLVAALLLDYRDTTVLVAGLLLIAFGITELLGGGFTLLPTGLLGRFQGERTAAAVFGTGLVYGLAGFCSGPLLGGVLTVASSSTNPLIGGSLLFVYALGTAAPLFVIASLWERFDLGRRAWLRGRTIRIGALAMHTNNVIAGLLLILLGASFIAFQGSSALSGVYDDLGLAEIGFRMQAWFLDRAGANTDAGAGVLAVVGLGGLLARRVQQRRQTQPRRDQAASPVENRGNAQQVEHASPVRAARRYTPRHVRCRSDGIELVDTGQWSMELVARLRVSSRFTALHGASSAMSLS
jgi:cytochrome c biogenesis protein CcdA